MPVAAAKHTLHQNIDRVGRRRLCRRSPFAGVWDPLRVPEWQSTWARAGPVLSRRTTPRMISVRPGTSRGVGFRR
jgi:hypothetical protein